MAPNVIALLEAPIIEFDSIDSTNNYAMHLIDADTAQPGLTITAKSQTAGKGQRGKKWESPTGKNLLMSIITCPQCPINNQFAFNASVAVAVAEVLQSLSENYKIYIKWPNDIIVNDKKAGGILIENVLRGSKWAYSVIGLGLNIEQESFPITLPFATSLKIETDQNFDIIPLRDALRKKILENTSMQVNADSIMQAYNELLYNKGVSQSFGNDTEEWKATILKAETNGKLTVQLADGKIVSYAHGEALWNWA